MDTVVPQFETLLTGTNTTATTNGVSKPRPTFGHEMRKHFSFDEKWINLNHGSFGAAPTAIHQTQQSLQLLNEQRPDHFIRYTYPTLLDKSREAVAALVKAPVDEVVLVQNATTAVNTVLRSINFKPGDKILYFDFVYPACGRTINYIEEITGAKGVRISLVFPTSNEEILRRFRETIARENPPSGEEGRIKLAMFDTISGLPAVLLPYHDLTKICKEENILSLIDGAHGIGQIPLDLTSLDADFFFSNLHKWLFVPRACALLHVPLRNQSLIRSSIPTSHGYIPPGGGCGNSNPLPESDKPPFISMFEFIGTMDNSAHLTVPAAISWRERVCGGEDAIMRYCSRIGRAGADLLARELGTRVMEREGGDACALWNVALPVLTIESGRGPECGGGGAVRVEAAHTRWVTDFMTKCMVEEYDTFIAVVENYDGEWWVRVSGQIYLELSDFEFAAGVLKELIRRVGEGKYLKGRKGE